MANDEQFSNLLNENDKDDSDLESDFDEDEDPDKIEVPGGGINLQTAAAYGKKASSSSLQSSDIKKSLIQENQLGWNTSRAAKDSTQIRNNVKVGMASMTSMGIPSASTSMSTSQQVNNIIMQHIQAMIAANPSYLTSGIPNDLLSKIVSASTIQQPIMQPQYLAMNAIAEEENDDEEELGVAETYADYMPSKLKLGKKHPDAVVETASLSSVEPVDVYHTLSIPNETIQSGSISALQLESVVYACQAHDHFLPDGSRAGFLIGDGAGVGKGRTIAGIIFENYLKGRRKSIWLSVSNDLRYDAKRDLSDIGANTIEVHALNKLRYAKINSSENHNIKKGVIFGTYSSLIGESQNNTGKYKSRLKQLLHWCGDDFDGVIVFDECHKAKNLCPTGSSKPTKTGLTALELQNKLPKARVVYASATGASEPRNMAYMVRLGIWGQGTPFPNFSDFINAVEKRGVGAMEIVAMDMKLRGMYIARQLSFHGVSFKIEEVPLSKNMKKVYDASVELWVEAMQKFTEAAELIDAESRMKKTMWGQFWSAHQRFFKYLCIAAKVNHAVKVAREAVKYGKCVVIGLQSTGEARTLEQLEKDDGYLNDFVSTAKGVFQSLVEKHFPAPDRKRIHRLLGISGDSKTALQRLMEEDSIKKTVSPGSSKRPPNRQAERLFSKKKRSSSPDVAIQASQTDDSDYQMSDSESNTNNSCSDSEVSSDYNPFKSDCSDSDDDPWVGKPTAKAKVKKKRKVSPKKRLSVQDKIQEHLTKKQTEVKPFMQTNGISIAIGGPPKDAIERACEMKEELLQRIEALGEELPPNTLDQLIDELGGPENVAEMTGRKGRVVQNDDGNIQYESRSEHDVPLETLNLTEKERFMNGEKDVAIISEAASSGISLQSDRRVKNQRRRVHITLELPWSADRAIQQFGRTHRSNQVNAPEYIFLISDLAGERRFASTVAKRLESLGALTHGDRRATETRDLSQFNIDNKYGKQALEAVMKTIMGYDRPLVPPPLDYKGDFFKDVAASLVGVGLIVNNEQMPGTLCLDKDYNNISKFLNRILGMKVELQNRIFRYFTDTLTAVIDQAKKQGKFDLGILDLGTAAENVCQVKITKFVRKHSTGVAPCELHEVQVERGMIWQEAIEKWADLSDPREGFYLSQTPRNGKIIGILAVMAESTKKKKNDTKPTKKEQIMFHIYRPNTGLQYRQESLMELEKKYRKVSSDQAEEAWTEQFDASVNTCSHAYWKGSCKNVSMGQDCEIGLRRRTYYVLSGSVLSVWARVEGILSRCHGSYNKMQVIRLRTTEGIKIVGTLIPKNCTSALIHSLSADAENVEEKICSKKGS